MSEWRTLDTAPSGVYLAFKSTKGEVYNGLWYAGSLHTVMGPVAWQPLPLEDALEAELSTRARQRLSADVVSAELTRLRGKYARAGLA